MLSGEISITQNWYVRTGLVYENAVHCTRMVIIIPICWILANYGIYCIYNNDLEVTAMLKSPEITMPWSSKVTTVCNVRREVWNDYEETKAYFLELMMSTDVENHERTEWFIFSSFMVWRSAATKTNNRKRASCRFRQLARLLLYDLNIIFSWFFEAF